MAILRTPLVNDPDFVSLDLDYPEPLPLQFGRVERLETPGPFGFHWGGTLPIGPMLVETQMGAVVGGEMLAISAAVLGAIVGFRRLP